MADADTVRRLEVRTLTSKGSSPPSSFSTPLPHLLSGMIGQHGVFVRPGHQLPAGSHFEYTGILRHDSEDVFGENTSIENYPDRYYHWEVQVEGEKYIITGFRQGIALLGP